MKILFTFFLFLSACGIRSSVQKSEDHIIGGSNVTRGEFRFIVQLRRNKGPSCGASLISDRWVMTAAHCVKNNNFTLHLGNVETRSDENLTLKFKNVFVHPEFSWPNHDIALIELDGRVLNSKTVPLNGEILEIPAGLTIPAWALGWGYNQVQSPTNPDVLQKIELPLVAKEICNQDATFIKNKWTITDTMLCAAVDSQTKSTCVGDSGGPVLIKRNNRWVQVGIISWGTGCFANRDLASFTAFVDVAAHREWIAKLVGN